MSTPAPGAAGGRRGHVLVAVGTQLAFDRLVDEMDRIAPSLGVPVVAQAGPGRGDWRNMEWAPSFPASEFIALAAGAHAIVGHAGIGTLLTARTHGRPAILLPRRAALGEHRNEHQLATARVLEGRPGVAVAWEAEEIGALLRPLLALSFADAGDALPGGAAASTREALIERLRGEIGAPHRTEADRSPDIASGGS